MLVLLKVQRALHPSRCLTKGLFLHCYEVFWFMLTQSVRTVQRSLYRKHMLV